jgi:hypothetical protein
MEDAERFHLLGSYRTPRFRVGQRVYCQVRGEMVITGMTDAPIPWPIGKRGGGRRSVIVYKGLAKAVRRESNQAVAYWWGAVDFVILCNATKGQALAMRQEVHDFLRDTLRLSLSMEKTRVVHLDEGFDFLGLHLRRSMGHKRMVTKVLISEKAIKRHRDLIRAATSPDTHRDSVVAKILALNRIIAGWCRYFQYTSKPSIQLFPLHEETFWRLAHWLGRKFKLSMPNVLRE